MTKPLGSRTPRSRRWVLTSAGLATAAAAVPTAWLAQSAIADEVDTLATVDMEKVLLAALVDPPKAGEGTTPGAKAHVLAVEKALKAKGLLKKDLVDGHFGSSTVAAYSKWQKKLGYSGLDASGLPGKTSLEKLGKGAFKVSHAIDVGSRNNSYGGKRVNTRTAKMLAAADKKLGWKITLEQGSYHPGNPDSWNTHDGGGVVDISVNGLSDKHRWQMVKALRTVGFAAWLRTPEQSFPYHIHATAVGDPDLSEHAQPQVHDYYYGKNGLAKHQKDNTPKKYRVDFTWWEKYKRG